MIHIELETKTVAENWDIKRHLLNYLGLFRDCGLSHILFLEYFSDRVRTHQLGRSISIDIFWPKIMVKNDLEFLILKITETLQRYMLTCQANSALLGRIFLHWAAATLKGQTNF